ncbi:MAG TPA: nucleotidyltransferase family protein [Vicinamibacterales bacterium]
MTTPQATVRPPHTVHEAPGDESAIEQVDVCHADPSVVARVQAFERTGDPSTLWPGLTETARVSALHEIDRVTRAVLAGSVGVHVDPDDAHATYALLIAGHTSGTGTLLGRWIADGIAVARQDVGRGFSEQLAHARRRADRLAREVAPALDALAARGVKPVALRGFHTSRVYFEEPGVRRMADIDLLVPPRLIDQAEAALRAVGFRPTTAVLRPYRRDWIAPTVSSGIFSVELDHERNRWNLDLHASLDRMFHPGAVARFDSESEHVERIDIDGRSLLALRAPLLLLTLACHCSQELHANRLLRLVEIVRVIRTNRASGGLDWDELLSMMKRTGTSRYAYPAFALAEELAPGTVDARVLAVCRGASTWAARHAVARLVPAGGSHDRRGAARQLMWARGSVAVAHWLLCALWPGGFTRPRDFLYGWRGRWRRLRDGRLSLSAPDERGTAFVHEQPERGGR